jgi:hypothetical protein
MFCGQGGRWAAERAGTCLCPETADSVRGLRTCNATSILHPHAVKVIDLAPSYRRRIAERGHPNEVPEGKGCVVKVGVPQRKATRNGFAAKNNIPADVAKVPGVSGSPRPLHALRRHLEKPPRVASKLQSQRNRTEPSNER